MVPGSPELLFVVLLFLVLSVPVLIWVAVTLNRAGGADRATGVDRATGADRDERLAQLERQVEDLAERVEQLESHRDESERDEPERFGTEWE